MKEPNYYPLRALPLAIASIIELIILIGSVILFREIAKFIIPISDFIYIIIATIILYNYYHHKAKSISIKEKGGK